MNEAQGVVAVNADVGGIAPTVKPRNDTPLAPPADLSRRVGLPRWSRPSPAGGRRRRPSSRPSRAVDRRRGGAPARRCQR